MRDIGIVGSWKGWSPVTPFTGLAATQQDCEIRTQF